MVTISEMSELGLKDHIGMYHEIELNHLCDICGRGFSSQSRLASHIQDHGGPHGGNRKKKPKVNFQPDDNVFDEDYFE